MPRSAPQAQPPLTHWPTPQAALQLVPFGSPVSSHTPELLQTPFTLHESPVEQLPPGAGSQALSSVLHEWQRSQVTATHAPLAGSQAWHGPQAIGLMAQAPFVHVPGWHLSAEQSVPFIFGVATQPVAGSQVPTLHASLLAEQSLRDVPEQAPLAHMPGSEQRSPPHDPLLSGDDEQVPVAGSQVGAEWHTCVGQTFAGSVTQVPLWQMFGCWHLSVVLQKPPSLIGVTVQLEVPLHVRLLHASPTQEMGVPAAQLPAPSQ